MSLAGDCTSQETLSRGAIRWKNPEYRVKVAEYVRKRYAEDAEFKRKRVQHTREWRKGRSENPAYREERAAKMRAYRKAKKAAKQTCEPQPPLTGEQV